MTPSWDRLKAVFSAAIEAEPAARESLLAELCAGDSRLEAEVRALLAAYDRHGAIDELADALHDGPAATASDPPPPIRIGRFEVVGTIGRGGMGIVYKARDPVLDRLVAVKVLLPGRVPDGEGRRRLLAEARAAAALDHPAIATVYEVGETEDGGVFLAMACYDGETLDARLARGPLPVPEAVRIAREIADGLAAAHASGITHRDLKPGNVFLTRSGAAKLLDFGIAKRTSRERDERDRTVLDGTVLERTETGRVMGTLAYMAPEQLRGQPVDARADVWAFGLVLSEMLTGERPDPTGAGGRSGAAGARPPGDRRDEVPAGLGEIIERCLRWVPADRYRSGADILAALERWVESSSRQGAAAAAGHATDASRLVRLPAPLTTFFGREREIEELARRLAAVRLLTLTGPGGIGKTRLALQVAAVYAAREEGGVVFVPLAAVSDPGLVPSEIGRALGVPERPDVPPVEALAAILSNSRLLLVLDNFEHIVIAASAVTRLLSACAGLRVLATSRVPLKVAGEHEYPVPPLRHPPTPASTTATDLEAYPATALFLDRARAAGSDLQATDEQARAIAEICSRLDGLPLAIELAAARVKLFSPQAMLGRLDRRFDLLGVGGRDRPARHQSLRQAIAWSHDLLGSEEQALFRRLSVFAGGGALDDVAAVCGALGMEESATVDGCLALLDHSLLVRGEGPGDVPRVRMLETIREFALERLQEAGEAEAARRAHARRYVALAERAEPHLTGPDQAVWFDALERDHENLRAALAWAEDRGEADAALRIGSALWRFWAVRGHLREGRERLERLLAMPGAVAPTLQRARVLHGLATLVHEISEMAGARALVEEGLAIARTVGDRPLTAAVLNNLAWIVVRMGEDAATTRAVCDEALALNCELDDRRGIAIALHNLGWYAGFRGEFDRACALHEESLGWRQAQGDRRGAAYAMTNLAWAEVGRGRLERAARLLDEAHAVLEALQDRQLLAWVLTIRGVLERVAGRPEAAADRFTAAVELWRGVGNLFGLGFALVGRGEAALDRGDREAASRDLEEGMGVLRQTGSASAFGNPLRAQARLAEMDGDVGRARALLREALALGERLEDAGGVRDCRAALARLGEED